ncbi:MAG: ferredoxin reductase family protein [Chloroflexi bacterium]|nr:ferredoxin reductase family protein [Chloroflexota bacterium]
MKRNIGNNTIAGIILVNLLLWIFFGPTEGVSKNFAMQKLAEMLSSSAMILIATALFLANKPRFLEPFFGGLDRMYVTHKNITLLALLVLLIHLIIVPASDNAGPGVWIGWFTYPSMLILVLLTIAPRVPLISHFAHLRYDQWRGLHKYMGVFFILGATHALMAEPLILHAPVVFGYAGTIVVIGALAYLNKEFLWDRLKKRGQYKVDSVKRLNGTTLEVTLHPRTSKLVHRAGQFLYVHFDSDKVLEEPHPFTISSAPREENLRVSIKASGDWTQHLHEHLKPGATAYVDGPYGEFNYKPGSKKQIWIAGGIGITPFLSWMRDFDDLHHEVHFFYTVAVPEEALFVDEIQGAAEKHGNFHAHILFTSKDGRLSVDKIIAASGDVTGRDVYMCGPVKMVEAFRETFLAKGLRPANIYYEEFNFR